MTTQWVIHGGALTHAMARFPAAPAPWLDLSTGINPVPWPIEQAEAPDWTRLPEAEEVAALETAAAACFGVDPEAVCATPGSEVCLRLLASVGLAAPYACLWPAYQTHAEGLPDCRRVLPEDLVHVSRQAGTLLLANPNNPDGRLLTPGTILEIAREKQRAGGWLVVDEAFIDAHEAGTIAPYIWGATPEYAGLPVVVLRSFGKFFGLPGLRLGFLIGPSHVVRQVRALLGSWPVNAAAIRIGRAAYEDANWHVATRQRLAGDREALDRLLVRYGLTPIGSSPLFRLVEVSHSMGGGMALFEHLAQHGILSRPFSYNPLWLRLGLPGSEACQTRLEAALATWQR